MSSFAGKVALVTGGTSGIGRATAIALAREGAQVVITGRREIEGKQVLQQIHRVNAICPELIDTAIQDRLWGNDEQAKVGFAAQSPAGRLGTPEEVAASVLYLCSEAASFVTGHSLVVDGAYLAQ